MEHMNEWYFRDIYKGGLRKDDLYICSHYSSVNFCYSSVVIKGRPE